MRKFLFLLSSLLLGVFIANGQDTINQSIPMDVLESVQNCSIEVDGPRVINGNEEYLRVEVSLIDSCWSSDLGIYASAKVSENDGLTLQKSRVELDSLGHANFIFSDFKESNKYEVIFYLEGIKVKSSPVLYSFSVRKSNWVFLMLVGLFGGLGFFLLGMNMMSNGMQNSAGDQLRVVLNKLTDNRFIAVGIGALVTTIIQSSSATNVMLVSFVNSRLMRFKQTIGIILGAAIGTTITAQIIAFKITDYALIFVVLGMVLHMMWKGNQVREVGRAILGFGILFYGMHVMSESMYPLRSYQAFIDLIVKFENPALGILVGAVITALIQSSSAFIGILIVLAMQGLLSLEASIALVIGANIGTAITALLASINTTREAKQVAIAHTLIKIVGALLFVFIIPLFTHIVSSISTGGVDGVASPREIANAHTIYNIVLCLTILPFTNSVSWVVNKIFPALEQEDLEVKFKYIDSGLISAPAMALKAAREELLRMMDEVQRMSCLIMEPFFDKQVEFVEAIDRSEEKVDFLQNGISDFLVELSRNNISENNVKEAFILMNAAREFEEIADVISSQLKKKAIDWVANSYDFSEDGKSELQSYHTLTIKLLQKSQKVYESLELKKAIKLKDRYSDYREEYFELERQHYKRLQSNVEETVSSSKTHLEIITLLKVICSHATNTARILIDENTPRKKKSKK